MTEPYYSKEQADTLHSLRDAAGGSAFDVAWTRLIADIRADMQAGGGPETDQAKALARRWKGLIKTFTNGDSEIERMLYEAGDKFYANAQLQEESPPNVLGYIRKVFEASGE